MKPILAALLFLVLATPARGMDKFYHELMDADIPAQKPEILASAMDLSPEEYAIFEEIFKDYLDARVRLRQSRNELVQEYAAVQPGMTEAIAQVMVRQFIQLETKEQEIRDKTIKKMREKKLNEVKIAWFYLADTKMNRLEELQIIGRLPMRPAR